MLGVQPSPYLQMLLRKRPSATDAYGDPTAEDTPQAQPLPPVPTIPIRAPRPVPDAQAYEQPDPGFTPRHTDSNDVGFNRPAPITPEVPALAQQPTVPVVPVATLPTDKADTAIGTAGVPSIPLKPRDVIAEDRQRLLDAQAKKPSLGRRILEGLGSYAASGIGLNLKPILHPGGTETERAQRQLATDLGIQKAQTENQDTQSTIALRGSQTKENEAQARKIQDALDNPDTSDEDKRKLEALRESLKMHPQPFDPSDPVDIDLLKKAKEAGILIPSAYGKLPKASPKLVAGRTVLIDGKNVYADENGDPIMNKAGQPIVHGIATPDKASGETQEEADKREAERLSLKMAADTAKGYAEHIDKNLLPPLYTERGNVKAELDRTDWKAEVAAKGETAAARHSALQEQYKALNSKIEGLETDRNKHNSEAGSKAAEALKYERKTQPASSNFIVPKNAKGRQWSKSTFAKSHPNADIEAAAKAMTDAGAKVVE